MRAWAAAVLTAAGAVALAIAVVPACTIDSRSDDFRCTRPSDCAMGRVCTDGWCIVDPDLIDASTVCPPACTRCEGDVCIIECSTAGACSDGKVGCPAGRPCDVRCTGANACAMGVECGNVPACTVTCDGPGSCAEQVRCGTGRCDVTCSGTGSCDGGIYCDASCACTTACSGTGACGGLIDCPQPSMCTSGGQCTAQPNPCNRC